MKSNIGNLKMIVVAGLLVLGLSACGSQESASTESKPTTEEVGGVLKVGSVVDGYLKLKDALVASNAEEAKKYAIASMEIVDAVAMPEVQQAIKEIAATTDLEKQRKSFESFSIHLYRQLKADNDRQEPLYKQYCPMAFDNQGAYWLSAQKEIRNPYFGDKMLKCGRVDEEIAAK